MFFKARPCATKHTDLLTHCYPILPFKGLLAFWPQVVCNFCFFDFRNKKHIHRNSTTTVKQALQVPPTTAFTMWVSQFRHGGIKWRDQGGFFFGCFFSQRKEHLPGKTRRYQENHWFLFGEWTSKQIFNKQVTLIESLLEKNKQVIQSALFIP